MFKGEAVTDYKRAANCWARFLLVQKPTVLIFEETQSASVTTMAGDLYTTDLQLRQVGGTVVYELHALRPIVNLGGAPQVYDGYLRACGLSGHAHG